MKLSFIKKFTSNNLFIVCRAQMSLDFAVTVSKGKPKSGCDFCSIYGSNAIGIEEEVIYATL